MQVLQSLGSKSCSDMEVGDIIQAVAAATFTAGVTEISTGTREAGAIGNGADGISDIGGSSLIGRPALGVRRSTFLWQRAQPQSSRARTTFPSNTALRSSSTARRLPSPKASTSGSSAATALANRLSSRSRRVWHKAIQANSLAAV